MRKKGAENEHENQRSDESIRRRSSEAMLDFFFECKEKAERKHYERLFSYGNDIDEPERTAVRHLEWALTDIAQSNKDWF